MLNFDVSGSGLPSDGCDQPEHTVPCSVLLVSVVVEHTFPVTNAATKHMRNCLENEDDQSFINNNEAK